MQEANFIVDKNKCIGCGKCLKVCPGNMIGKNTLKMENGYPVMEDQTTFGWNGCWKCERCFAVCPFGAISIFGVHPNEKLEKPSSHIKEDLPKLIRYRRSCRLFKNKEVDHKLILEIMDTMACIPTGGNNSSLEFSIVENKSGMNKLYEAIYGKNKQLNLFGEYEENNLNKLRLYNAPCCFIAHKTNKTKFKSGMLTELGMSTAYFELLVNSYGLASIITNQTADLISKSNEARKILGIPEDHIILSVVGFGYPEIEFARGIEKTKKTTYLK